MRTHFVPLTIAQRLALDLAQAEYGIARCPLVPLHVHNMGLQEFVQTVPAIRTANPALSPAGMEPLHGFEVLAIDIRFTESNLLACPQRHVQIFGVD